jgi:hypothetical protein
MWMCTPACFLGATATAACATSAIDSKALCGCVPSCFLGAVACASDSAKLGNVLPAGYLLSGGTAKNSSCLNGHTEAALSVCNSVCVNGHAEAALSVCNAVCVNGHAEANLSVANSACLGGVLAACYASLASPAFTTCLTVPIACVATCVRSPIISGGTICALTAFCSVAGCGFAVDWVASSDIKIKKDITPITCALSIIKQLHGVNYKLCTDESESCRIGMIAQEVEKIIPSIVSCEETKGIAYGKLVAVLVEGMKEQQRQIDDLKKDLNYFRNYNP